LIEAQVLVDPQDLVDEAVKLRSLLPRG
jgi:hypothetical protein